MAYYPGTELDEEDETGLDDAPAPASSIAGPQTPREQVMQRIAQVRGGGQPDEQGGSSQMPSSLGPSDLAALNFAQQSSQTAGVGRALNALAAGTGYKPDNSGYESMEKNGANLAEKEMSRSAQVQKAIEDRKLRQSLGEQSLALRKDDNARKDKQTSAYIDRTNTMGDLVKNRQSTANIRAANTVLSDKNAQTEVKKLNSARAAQSLVDDIRGGKLTDSKNVAKQLTNLITTIEMGSPGGTSDRQSMGVDTLYGRLKGALSYVSGHPNSSIPSDYLDQLESEVHALGDRAAANFKNVTDGALSGADLSSGDPDVEPGQVFALAKARRDKILSGSGYDPETGQPLKKRQGSGSSQHAHAPGSIVKVQGKLYKVGADGDTLEPAT